jgi:hypothetical protein
LKKRAEWDQWWIGGREGLGLASVNESKDVDQIQAIAFLDASVSLLDSQFGSERSITEPSGRMFLLNRMLHRHLLILQRFTASLFDALIAANAVNATLSR